MKTTMGYHYTAIGITKIRMVPTPNAGGVRQNLSTLTLLEGEKVQSLGKSFSVS